MAQIGHVRHEQHLRDIHEIFPILEWFSFAEIKLALESQADTVNPLVVRPFRLAGKQNYAGRGFVNWLVLS